MNKINSKQVFTDAIKIWHFALSVNDKELYETMEKAISMITKHLEDEENANNETEH